jgi:hypothetical protein
VLAETDRDGKLIEHHVHVQFSIRAVSGNESLAPGVYWIAWRFAVEPPVAKASNPANLLFGWRVESQVLAEARLWATRSRMSQ